MRAFLEMGGYGAFVWSAFTLTLLAMAGLLWQSRREALRQDAELEALRRQVRPQAARPRRPLVPVREVEAGEIGARVGESG